VTDLEYKAYVVHDNDAVYFAIDVTDEAVRTTHSDVEQLPDLQTWEDDSVELFFDIDNSKAFGGGTAQAEGVFEGQYTQTHKGFYYDGSPSKDAIKGVHWSGTARSRRRAINWNSILPLGSPTNGASIGFLSRSMTMMRWKITRTSVGLAGTP
jgi:hypothetical protein